MTRVRFEAPRRRMAAVSGMARQFRRYLCFVKLTQSGKMARTR